MRTGELAMSGQRAKSVVLLAVGCIALFVGMMASAQDAPANVNQLDQELELVLRKASFTGRIESTLKQRLGRELDLQLADVGRLTIMVL
jgi:hypothetical protein